MTQTDGEKELVLGNKQLISLFFVVVALCGVFFAMGYMIGHNTSRTASFDGATSATAVPPAAADSPSPDAQPPDGQSTSAQSTDAQTPAPQPADSSSPTAAAPDTPQPAPADAAPSERQSSSARSESTRTQAAHDSPAVPEAGATYLQVTALRRADADNLIRTLREQHFPALLAESSKPDLFRVLVGPYHQMADVADAKSRLKALGFANAFVQK